MFKSADWHFLSYRIITTVFAVIPAILFEMLVFFNGQGSPISNAIWLFALSLGGIAATLLVLSKQLFNNSIFDVAEYYATQEYPIVGWPLTIAIQVGSVLITIWLTIKAVPQIGQSQDATTMLVGAGVSAFIIAFGVFMMRFLFWCGITALGLAMKELLEKIENMSWRRKESLWIYCGAVVAIIPAITAVLTVILGIRHLQDLNTQRAVLLFILVLCAAAAWCLATQESILRVLHDYEWELLFQLHPPMGVVIWVAIEILSVILTIFSARSFAFTPENLYTSGPLIALILLIAGQVCARLLLVLAFIFGGAALYIILHKVSERKSES